MSAVMWDPNKWCLPSESWHVPLTAPSVEVDTCQERLSVGSSCSQARGHDTLKRYAIPAGQGDKAADTQR